MRHHRQTLRAAQEALAKALQDLEETRMLPHDDPILSELKEDIRNVLNAGIEPELAISE